MTKSKKKSAKKATKKVQIKTGLSGASVSSYLNGIESAKARKEAKALAKVFKEVSGSRPKMWGESIVGYGKYVYARANGDVGEFMATGFSMRKSGPVVYIMPGFAGAKSLLKKLGKHKLGKSCLYLKSLNDIDIAVLRELIAASLIDLKKIHEVKL